MDGKDVSTSSKVSSPCVARVILLRTMGCDWLLVRLSSGVRLLHHHVQHNLPNPAGSGRKDQWSASWDSDGFSFDLSEAPLPVEGWCLWCLFVRPRMHTECQQWPDWGRTQFHISICSSLRSYFQKPYSCTAEMNLSTSHSLWRRLGVNQLTGVNMILWGSFFTLSAPK